MDIKMVDVMLHIKEDIDADAREALRDSMLSMQGVMAADYNNDRPHLLIIEYDPDTIASAEFLHVAQRSGLQAQLIGM